MDRKIENKGFQKMCIKASFSPIVWRFVQYTLITAAITTAISFKKQQL